MKGLLIGGGALLAFFSGLPLFLLVAVLGLVLLLHNGMEPKSLALKFLYSFDNPTLLSIPCFIFQGMLLTEGKSGGAVTAFLVGTLGRLRGGVGVASVLTSGFFSALSGSSPSALVAAGGLLRPALVKEGVSDQRAVGLLTVAGSLGVLLPPSVPVILYSVVGREDPVAMFKACFVAALGLLVIFGVLGAAANRNTVREEGKQAVAVQEPVGRLLLAAGPVLVLPVGIIALVGLGVATVQGAAALGVFYTLALEAVVFRSIWSREGVASLGRAVARTASMTAAILFIVGMGATLNLIITELQIAEWVTEYLTLNFKHPLLFLLAVNVIFLLAGCVMDLYAALLIFVPLLLPAARELDLNLVHLGAVILLNLEVGFVTPPFGINLFAASAYFSLPLLEVVRRVGPFLLAMVAWLLVVTFVPGLTLFLV